MPYKNILLVQLRQLGDILLTTPCIREIKKECPEAKVSFLSHRMGQAILKDNPYLDQLIVYHEKFSLFENWQLIQALRKERFDLVIDFMHNPRSAFLSFLTSSPNRWAQRSARRWAYQHVVPRGAGEVYALEEKFALLRACGFHPQDPSLTLPWSDADLRPWEMMLAEHPELKDAPLRVVLSPTHRRLERKWPLASYAQLATYLCERWQASVIWIWGPGEEEEIDEAQKLCSVPTWKAPKTSLQELAALLAQQDLFIGNSNGPSHIAVASGVCSLQLHGPTSARSWCPMTERHQALQTCAGMEAIGVEAVWQKLEQMRPMLLQQAK